MKYIIDIASWCSWSLFCRCREHKEWKLVPSNLIPSLLCQVFFAPDVDWIMWNLHCKHFHICITLLVPTMYFYLLLNTSCLCVAAIMNSLVKVMVETLLYVLAYYAGFSSIYHNKMVLCCGWPTCLTICVCFKLLCEGISVYGWSLNS